MTERQNTWKPTFNSTFLLIVFFLVSISSVAQEQNKTTFKNEILNGRVDSLDQRIYKLCLEKINWINNINYKLPLNCSIQVRHQHTPVNCKIIGDNDIFKVLFADPIRAIAPGQSAVFYNNNIYNDNKNNSKFIKINKM